MSTQSIFLVTPHPWVDAVQQADLQIALPLQTPLRSEVPYLQAQILLTHHLLG